MNEIKMKENMESLTGGTNGTVYAALLQKQRVFFATGCTKDVSFRIESLRRLARWVRGHNEDIFSEIIDIENINIQQITYTVELSDNDNFIANGMLVKTEIVK